jgi:hypothetical protein
MQRSQEIEMIWTSFSINKRKKILQTGHGQSELAIARSWGWSVDLTVPPIDHCRDLPTEKRNTDIDSRHWS